MDYLSDTDDSTEVNTAVLASAAEANIPASATEANTVVPASVTGGFRTQSGRPSSDVWTYVKVTRQFEVSWCSTYCWDI